MAVAGTCGDPADRPKIIRKLNNIFVELRLRAEDYNSEEYGFSGKAVHIGLLSEPGFSDSLWTELAEEDDLPFDTAGAGMDAAGDLENGEPDLPVDPTEGVHTIENRTARYNRLLDQADLAVLLWNEREDEKNIYACELLQMGRQKKVPCIWISTKAENRIYWSEDSYFEEYSPKRLKSFCALLLGIKAEENAGKKGNIPFISTGDRLYNRFMRKYKAKLKPMPYVVDQMLGDDFPGFEKGSAEERTRENLVEYFNWFDRAAIESAQKYRASIYLRSILPFVATTFLCVGFYAETVIGYFLRVSVFGLSVWSLLAGICFMVHAMINLYAAYLSDHKTARGWHFDFLNNRFLAETLRILVHFLPFGISLNIRNVISRCSGRLAKDNRLYSKIHRIMRSTQLSSVSFDRKSVKQLLENISLLIDDQILYHRNDAARYRCILKNLSGTGLIAFQVGFVFVLFRGLLQFGLVYVPFPGSSNGVATTSFIRSFANMLALLLPAWASYFSTKLSLCNFKALLENDEDMMGELGKMRRLITDLQEKGDASFEVLRSLAEELTVLLLSEVTGWYAQLSTKQLTKL